MVSFDTNVLVRIFVDDQNTDQVNKARKLAKKVKKIFISQVVQIELVWVLSRAFKLAKVDVLKILDDMHSNAAFVLQNPDEFIQALELYRSNSIDFSDSMIFVNSNNNQTKIIYTFDQKFSNLSGVELVE